MNKTLIFSYILLISLVSCIKTDDNINYAEGIIFHDLNENGLLDDGEHPLQGVAVSNGRDVVLSNQDGAYKIPVTNDNTIFVIKPGNYRYPVNENNLPQFYYTHKPEGSPALEYAGVKPTGELPEKINFGLLTGAHTDKFSVVVLSDPQVYNHTELEYYDKGIVEELVNVKDLDFGITLGDLVGDRLDLFEPLNKATARIGIPWYNVIGNHDINFDIQNPSHADETFQRVYGPSTYAFMHGKVLFFVINNIIYPNEFTSHSYVGGLTEDQFHFINNLLKIVPKNYLVVLNMHIPLFNEHPFGETFLNIHRDRLFRILKDRPHTFSMSGHTHTQRHHYFTKNDGWLKDEPHHHYNVGTASGDWWTGKKDDNGVPDATMRDGTPKGYNLIHFNGNSYTFDYNVAGASEDYKMRIYGPKVVSQKTRYNGEVYVNFFQGCQKCTVEFSINDSQEWNTMRYVDEQDPHIASVRYVWDTSDSLLEGNRPSNPSYCYHLWKVRIPRNLPEGTNSFLVKVTDSFGREFFETFEFDVIAN